MGNSSSVLDVERAKLTKEGKQILDDSIASCKDMGEKERYDTVEAQLKLLLIEKALSPVLFVDFDWFKKQDHIPRCTDNFNCAVRVEDIDRSKSLMVFVSHTWLRGWSGAEGWSGKPHPDNASNDKFTLICKGIDAIWCRMAHKMKKCYIWLDFACVNQDMDPGGQLESLDKIMQYCDLMFTPIANKDDDFSHREFKDKSPIECANTSLLNYSAKEWNSDPLAYLNRAWCRLEMLYAAHIPLMPNRDSEVARHTLFECDLHRACRMNRRPHFLYGDNEVKAKKPPKILPPQQRNFAALYPPLEGAFSIMTDINNISALLNDLQPYVEAHGSKLGYIGDINATGLPHGRGVTHYPSGDVFEGDWLNGQSHGLGTYKWANGDVYEGRFENGRMHGYGTIRSVHGEAFKGEFKEGLLLTIEKQELVQVEFY